MPTVPGQLDPGSLTEFLADDAPTYAQEPVTPEPVAAPSGILKPVEAAPEPTEGLTDFLSGSDELPKLQVANQQFGDRAPEKAARVLKLELDTGLPSLFIEENLDEIEKQVRVQGFKPEEFRTKNPKLSAWIAKNPHHFPLVKDDLGFFGKIENAFQEGGLRASGLDEMAGLLYQDMEGTPLTAAQEKRMKDLKAWMQSEAARGAEDSTLQDLARASGYSFGQAATTWKGSSQGILAGAATGAGLGALAGAGVGAAPGAIAGATAGWASASALKTYQMESALAFDELKNLQDLDGVPMDRESARLAAKGVGAINAAIETGSDYLIAKLIPGFDKAVGGVTKKTVMDAVKTALAQPARRQAVLSALGKMAKGSLIEGAEEFTQSLVGATGREVGQAMSGQAFADDSLGDDLGQAAGEAGQAIKGSFFSFGLVTGGTNYISQEVKIRQAEKTARFYQALSEGKDSKAFKALPEKAQEAVAAMTEDGPLATAYIDPGTWRTYWQDKADPREVAAQIFQDGGKAYDEAVATGEDLAIPTAVYARRIAPTEHNQFFSQELRREPGEMNAREAAEARSKLQELATSAETETPLSDAEEQEMAPIRAEIKDQLRATGHFTERQIETNVRLMEDRIKRRAQVRGESITDTYRGKGLTIQNPDNPEFNPYAQVDQLDPLLDRLRSGDLPSEKEAKGSSLLPFLKSRGGLAPNGELKAIGLEGLKQFIKKGGLELDRAAQEAVESGYLPEGSGINELIEAVGEEIKGALRYSPAREKANLTESLAIFNDLKVRLEKLGVDLSSVDNATAKRMLQEAQAELSEPFLQSGPDAPELSLDADYFKSPEGKGDLQLPELNSDELGLLNKPSKPVVIKETVAVKNQKHAKAIRGRDQAILRAALYSPTHIIQSKPSKRGNYFTFVRKVPGTSEAVVIELSETKEAYEVVGWRPMSEKSFQKLQNETGREGGLILITGRDESQPAAVGLSALPPGKSTIAHNSGLDMSREARLKRAKEQGFDTDTVYYHGTKADIEAFDPSKLGESTKAESAANAFFFTDSPRVAELFGYIAPTSAAKKYESLNDEYERRFQAGEKESSRSMKKLLKDIEVARQAADNLGRHKLTDAENRIYPTHLRMQNPLTVEMGGKEFDPGELNKYLKRAKTAGHDGVVFENAIDTPHRTDRTPSRIVAVFSPNQVRSVNAAFDPNETASPNILFQSDESTARGRIRFGSTQDIIDLFKNADLSTLPHELAHRFLEEMGDDFDYLSGLEGRSSLSEVQRRFISDYETVLKWFGVKNRSEIETRHHELFAETFEAYLMTGKAPSQSLRAVFARFRVWITAVYRRLKREGLEVNPEVRAVFDRLLAAEDETQAARAEQAMTPLFTDPAAVGMTEAQAESYQAAVYEARQAAEEELAQKVMAEVLREREAYWKEERAKVRFQFEQEVNSRQVYIALSILQKGALPEGSNLPEGVEAFKISKESLIQAYGKDFIKRLPKPYVYAKDGGLHMNVAAELLGYPSGDALVMDLVNAEPKDALINRLTDQEMKDQHGDLLTDGTIAVEAMKAVHNDKRAELLRKELQWLASNKLSTVKGLIRKLGRRVPPIDAFRMEANRILSTKKVKEISPIRYQRAEQKAAKEAMSAFLKGDIEAAFDAKQREFLNHELYRAAVRAKEEVDQSHEFFKKLSRKDGDLAKSRDMDLVNAARAILAQYGIGRAEKSAASYLEQIKAYDPETYEVVQGLVSIGADRAAPFREVSYDDFIAMRDTVQALWDLAKANRQIIIDGKAMTREQVMAELQDQMSLISKPENRLGYNHAATDWEKAKLHLMGMRASLRRVESWVDVMDMGDINGPFRRYIWNPISESISRFREAKKTIIEAYLEKVKAVEKSLTQQEIKASELNYRFKDKAELLGALLHTGNESNFSKLLRGREWGTVRADGSLDSSRWEAFIRRMWAENVLTKADYEFVQSIWDLMDSLKLEAQRAHKRMYGHYFSEITAKPIETPFGTFKGGYMPAVVDQFASSDAAIRGEKESLEKSNNSFMFPTAGRGFTKSRVDQYAAPLAMDLRFVPAHLDKVLRFIHIEPHVKEVGRVVMDKGFRRELDSIDAAVGGDMLIPWLQRSAQQTIETRSKGWGGRAADTFFKALRTRTGMQVMVGNVVNTLQQFTGLTIAGLKVQPKYLRNALWNYMRQPSQVAESVNEKSSFMRTRTSSQAFDIQKQIDDLILNPNEFQKARDFATKHGYFMQAGAQNLVDLIVWSGAYDEAVANGETELTAVRSADAAVRQTQGSFSPEDVSRFETGTPFMRAFTMFYSYFNMQANLLGTEFAKIIQDMGLRKGAGRLLYVYALGFMLPAVLSEMIVRGMSGKGLDEDDDDQYLDDFLSVFFGSQARTATAYFPLVGPSINAGLNAWNDKWYDDRITTSPAISAIESTVRAPHSVYTAISEGKNSNRAVKDSLTAIGLLTGLPTAALARPGGYIADVLEGKTEPKDPVDFIRGLATGKHSGP
jgi:hypothetical protein